ncbi:sigma-70 family RNA polymerase sigma factor [Bacillus cytotoxicus]|uniref:RNA polymerase, sigma-24 subunit, ECF subfamily n=1 Tax=Bacillus cytotoxicus TaxID=580165 RepID=A0AAX2CNF4_9BACI|nr:MULTISPECIES: sigma-70 family RNA polymerase sigma factor [Bacillus cereus group]AWC30716.1 RNA polymerase subunit sigma-24 [Bacillus cytotoxicus]AWC42858.1 RNA polymerase subunit sigma-24 [Bacillus cytotoxicus]AWC50789.1 RNA polymerase subunit sigma-24 [Bacillus cytotoxicus]AWC54844.1 RNA polymerase subunit sigma-24 [Bacillus cytotoxicus]AWC58966.1 RNA polymerase subunit sigma-24 [Bacillus cytotoxicus]
MNDKELVGELKNQNIEALDQVILQYSRLIYGVIGSILGENHERVEIEECYNDVLFILWYKIDHFQIEKGQFKNWIISIAKFKALDYKRKFKRKLIEQTMERCILQDKEDVEQVLLKEEEKEFVLEAIQRLDQVDYHIFYRRYIADESIKQISEELHMSTSAIYTRLSRGREKLKKGMEGYYEV